MYRSHRLYLLISTVIFFSFSILIILNTYEKIRDLKTFQIERELPALGIAAYSQFNYIAAGYKAAGEKLLKDDYIRDWITDGERNPEQLTAFMESVRAENDLLDASLVSDLTETYYGTDGRILKLSPLNEQRDGWYYHYRETAADTNIDSWLYPETGVIGLYVNIPVISEDGSFLGVTGGGIDGMVFDEILKYFEHTWDVDLYIIRNDGHLVYATDTGLLDSDNDSIDRIWNSPVIDRITREKLNKSGIVFEPEGDADALLWGGYMPEWESFLIIERRREDLNEKIISVIKKSLIFEVGITGIMFILSLLVLRYISRANNGLMKSRLSYVHKLQSVVYVQDAVLGESSRLLSSFGSNPEIKRLTPLYAEALERVYLNEQISGALKLTASDNFSGRQVHKINLNDLINEILLKKTPEARKRGLSLMGKMPANQLIIKSNEALLGFCIENMLEEAMAAAVVESEIFCIAGCRGLGIWLDIVFRHKMQKDFINISILEPIFELLDIQIAVKTEIPGSLVVKLEFQPSGE